MASSKFRIIINLFIGAVCLFLSFIMIGSILFLIFQKISLLFLIILIPLWIIIIFLEREFVWTLIFLNKKEPYKHLTETSGKHERLLKEYQNEKKKSDYIIHYTMDQEKTIETKEI